MTEELEQVLTEVVLKHPLEQLVEWSKLYREKGAEGLTEVIRALPATQQKARADFPLKHHFAKSNIDGKNRGVYAREVFVPANHFILTERHKTQHPFVVSAGACSIWTPENGLQCIQAPYTGITEPGTQRLIFVHEDTVWTTFHPTDETDLEKIEAQLIDKSGAFAPIEIQALQEVSQ